MPSGKLAIGSADSRGLGDDREKREQGLARVSLALSEANEAEIDRLRIKNLKKWQKIESKSTNLNYKQQEKLRQKKKKDDDKLAAKKTAQNKKDDELNAKYRAMLEEKALQETANQRRNIEKELAEYQAKKLGDSITQATNGAIDGDKMVGNITKGLNKVGAAVEDNLDIYTKYMTSIEARLQGAGKNLNYASLNRVISQNTAANPYIKYTAVLDNLANLVSEGIADNVAQRAFLATISDKIATTFDAANASLLQIVRLQRQDSTASRLGMEANLTRVLNYYFSDTSYLSDNFDTIQDSLMDISSQLSTASSIELEYQVQKWLGALGSVGVDSSTLQSIAQGINALGTGDVETLSSNQALQNLFVMAAKRQNLSYAGMLTKGINSQEVNSLLAGIVGYIQEISQGSNNVVKKQYAQLFGMTMSDMRAFQNLSDDVINSLYKTAMTYQNTLDELDSQLRQVSGRMHLSEKIQNVFDNILTVTGMQIANSPLAYGTYKAFDTLEGITGGINLPFIPVFGNGLDLNMSLEGIAKGSIIGISATAALLQGISSALKGNMLSYEAWEVPDLYTKDSGFKTFQSAGELSTSKSSTNYVTSGNSTGIQQSINDTQKETGEEVTGTKTGSGEEMIQIMRFLQDYFEEGGSDGTKPLKVSISGVADGIIIGRSYSPGGINSNPSTTGSGY